uniref:RNase H type-1 domain-containing protein n=1 Tax=Hyaloperonospora arabidopsidis (strain Emoy2) TaxID=559515 RepID=M4C0C3_HYAAE
MAKLGSVVICGDSNPVIRQMRDKVDCKGPDIKLLLLHKAIQKLRSCPKYEFLHIKREWNQSADRLESASLQQEKGTIVTSDQVLQDLTSLNRLGELFMPKMMDRVGKMAAITRSAQRRLRRPEILPEEIVQQMRIERKSRHKKKKSGSPT